MIRELLIESNTSTMSQQISQTTIIDSRTISVRLSYEFQTGNNEKGLFVPVNTANFIPVKRKLLGRI